MLASGPFFIYIILENSDLFKDILMSGKKCYLNFSVLFLFVVKVVWK